MCSLFQCALQRVCSLSNSCVMRVLYGVTSVSVFSCVSQTVRSKSTHVSHQRMADDCGGKAGGFNKN